MTSWGALVGHSLAALALRPLLLLPPAVPKDLQLARRIRGPVYGVSSF